MEFIKAFENIDKDFSGEITREELTEYMHQKNYKPAFVEKWMKIFDADNSGTITLEEFCDTLGLVVSTQHRDKIKKRKEEKQIEMLESKEAEEREIEVIAKDPDVSASLIDFAKVLCLESVKKFNDCLEVSRHVKEKLDCTFERCWHVVAGVDGYGCLISHESGGFIHIRARKFGIMMWQVKADK